MAYERHNWQCGETVTAELLNNIEDGIAEALDCCSGGGSNVATFEFGAYTSEQNDYAFALSGIPLWASPQEIFSALDKGKTIEIELTNSTKEFVGEVSSSGELLKSVKFISIVPSADPNHALDSGTVTLETTKDNGNVVQEAVNYTNITTKPLYFFSSGELYN